MNELQKAVQMLYKGALKTIEGLMELDPEPNTPEGRLLADLTATVQEYERSLLNDDQP